MKNAEELTKKSRRRLSFDHFIYKTLILLLIFIYIFILNTLYAAPEYGPAYMIIAMAFIGGLWMLLPRIADKLITVVLLVIYMAYMLSQRVYHFGFGAYFYLKYALSLRTEVSEAGSAIVELIEPIDYVMLALGLIIILAIILIRGEKKRSLKQRLVFNIITSLLLAGSGYGFYSYFDNELSTTDIDSFVYNESDRYIYDVIPSTDAFVAKFGINAFFFKDIYNSFLAPIVDDYSDKEADIDAYLESKDTEGEENDYTGIFEGKNLIVLQCESLMTIGIDPILTPTLYQLFTTGMDFENFNAPLLPGSTSDTEIMVQDSLYPITNGYATMHTYATNTYPVTLAKLFKSEDYSTAIFHNNYGIYYNRDVFYGNDAYDKFYDTTEMGLENLSSDYTMMDYAAWIVAEQDSFYDYFITYSGHQPYSLTADDPAMSDAAIAEYAGYIDIINETYPGLDEFMQVYLAKCMSLDRGVQQLIVALETYGKLDDTVFVLFGDHYIKGYIEEDHLDSLAILGQSEARVPLIIWTADGSYQQIDKYCNSLDVLPTLMNMFNIDYDHRYVCGYDIFDDDYIGYRFTVNGSLTSTDFYFNYETGLTTYNGMSEAEAMAWVDSFERMKTISQYIIELDYFKRE